jgi:L-threonylcarbamoyladenylate synthase
MKTVKFTGKNTEEVVKTALETLEKGGLVVYPTETCYGLGVDATNQEAVDKILSYKKKRAGKAILVAVSGKEMAKEYVEVNEVAKNIYDNYLPGPISVVSKGRNKVAKGVQSEDGTLGIRVSNYPLVLEITKALGKPITSTSANPSHKKNPYIIDDVLKNISKKQRGLIDLIIDAGQLPKRKASTVINTTLNEIQILSVCDVNLKSPKTFVSNSEDDTKKLAADLVKSDKNLGKRPLVFALQGELGTGKTQFTKGLAKQMGIKETVLSPTFIISREYEFGKGQMLFHIDAYRLFDEKEFIEIGFRQMIEKPNIIVIEWAEKVSKTLRENRDKYELIWIKFEYDGEKSRKIEYSNEVL